MKLDKKTMLLYAVTDRTWTGRQTLEQQVESALKGGATCIQLREKDMEFEQFLAEAIRLKSICREYGVPFIINDNVEIAVQCKADGVHVGQHDMALTEVRKIVGDDMIIGVSAQTLKQATEAEANGADYLGVGAVFSTSTKLDAAEVTHDTLRQICRAVSIPVVAIGGINENNIMELSGTNVDGVAIVSAIFSAENIETQCKKLRQAAEEMVKR